MKKLESDDLQAGQFVTVLAWKPQERTTSAGLFGGLQTIKVQDRSFFGDVLRVVAIDRPFVVVQGVSGFVAGRKVSIDTRECDLALLSDEYVDALAPNARGGAS